MATERLSPTVSGARTSSIPQLLYTCGTERRMLLLERFPFTIGRKSDKTLVISDARVSRDHAEILEDNGPVLVDLGSKHGTYVNGQRVQRHKLRAGDCIEFGGRGVASLVFKPDASETGTTGAAHEFLSQMSVIEKRGGEAAELEKLNVFLELLRKLSAGGVVDDVLATMIDATVRLTGAERGYIFLRQPDGKLRMRAARNSKGERLADDGTISRSIVEDAASSAAEFFVPDSMNVSGVWARQSIVAHDLRTVICIPMRPLIPPTASEEAVRQSTLGVLYLDSHMASGKLSATSEDVLRAIAHETASLVENTRLLEAEAESRRIEQELSTAAMIQQAFMSSTLPEVPYARVQAKSISCRQIGGDFFDAVSTKNGIALVITDVSGKGVSAAILASIVQGMTYSELQAGVSLPDIVDAANRYLCQKQSEKYATMIIAQLAPDGELEYVNCGHIPPVLVREGGIERLTEGNLPVGLICSTTYKSSRVRLQPGDNLILLTDGVTEAENSEGEFFGDERLASVAQGGVDGILRAVHEFRGPVALADDCSVVQLTYQPF